MFPFDDVIMTLVGRLSCWGRCSYDCSLPVDRHFLAWLLIGKRLPCTPVRRHVTKFLSLNWESHGHANPRSVDSMIWEPLQYQIKLTLRFRKVAMKYERRLSSKVGRLLPIHLPNCIAISAFKNTIFAIWRNLMIRRPIGYGTGSGTLTQVKRRCCNLYAMTTPLSFKSRASFGQGLWQRNIGEGFCFGRE